MDSQNDKGTEFVNRNWWANDRDDTRKRSHNQLMMINDDDDDASGKVATYPTTFIMHCKEFSIECVDSRGVHTSVNNA